MPSFDLLIQQSPSSGEIEFDEKASTMRFASKEAREEAKALFMKECLAK